jgi:hypothetical protein
MISSNFVTESSQIKYDNLISLPIHTNIAYSYIQNYMFGIPIKYYKISNNKQVNKTVNILKFIAKQEFQARPDY